MSVISKFLIIGLFLCFGKGVSANPFDTVQLYTTSKVTMRMFGIQSARTLMMQV